MASLLKKMASLPVLVALVLSLLLCLCLLGSEYFFIQNSFYFKNILISFDGPAVTAEVSLDFESSTYFSTFQVLFFSVFLFLLIPCFNIGTLFHLIRLTKANATYWWMMLIPYLWQLLMAHL